jgi:hypothetical protein
MAVTPSRDTGVTLTRIPHTATTALEDAPVGHPVHALDVTDGTDPNGTDAGLRASGRRDDEIGRRPPEGPRTAASSTAERQAGTAADGELGGLVATLREMDRLAARAVEQAGQLDGNRVVAEEGMAVETALRLYSGATRTDLSTLLTAGDILADMPAATSLFRSGVLSWGHVRALTTGVRGLGRTTREALDAHLDEHAERLAALDSDGRLGAIDDALAHVERMRRAEERAAKEASGRRLIVSPRLDGSGTLFSDLDPEGFAAVTGRLEAEADTPRATPSPGDDGHDLPSNAREPKPNRAQALADALVRLCERRSSSDGSVPVRLSVTLDVDRLTDTFAGTLRPAIAARPPRLVRRTLDRFACDAAYDLVVRRGNEIVAAQRRSPELTAATRRAVASRDGGCRFPGCRAPVTWCDVHHVSPRATGDDHALENLVLLCRRHHTTVHQRGWDQRLRADGTYHLMRRGRRWTTLPRRDREIPPPDPPDRAAGADPDPGG